MGMRMQVRSMLRILGLLIALFSMSSLPPLAVAWYYGNGGASAFISSFVLCVSIGSLLWALNRQQKNPLKTRESFIIVVMFWVVLASVGAIPFWWPDVYALSFTDSMFESFSALTTTGATVLTGIDELPHAYRFYRQQLQWLGGMGIIVLAVAVLPLLGIGGMQLFRAETTGPLKDNKLTPRIADTAKHLWYIYMGITCACALAYWFAGMSVFDAVGHAMSTVAIGGFSTHDANLGYFGSGWVNLIAMVFILIAGVNFALHFGAVRGKTIRGYLGDPELRAFLFIQLVLISVCTSTLVALDWHGDLWTSVSHAALQAVSIGATAGFTTDEYASWPLFLPMLLILASFIGGSAGSTAGGLKVIRVLLLFRQGVRELNRLVHPKGVFSIKYGNRPLPDRVVQAVWGFFAAYALVFVCIMLAFIGTGLDDYSAFGATAATLNNLGAGLGSVAMTFAEVSQAGKWVAIIAMLFGRLEVFTLLVLFTPAFWRG